MRERVEGCEEGCKGMSVRGLDTCTYIYTCTCRIGNRARKNTFHMQQYWTIQLKQLALPELYDHLATTVHTEKF